MGQGKQDTYITPSDTSTWSLKKSIGRCPAGSDLSPMFNYHIWVP